jgi:calcineurin-like phosphoesterase family protein
MNKTWLITDTHFDHDRIGVYCDRPDGWMDKILKNWRDIVKDEDTVIHLGDVQVGHKQSLDALLKSLPGMKILVRGNHDQASKLWYMRNGFQFACDGISFAGVTFTHRPVNSLYDGTDLNIHGHVHNSAWNPTKPFHRLLAIEHVDYRPVDLLKWVNMARSERHWADYRKNVIDRRNIVVQRRDNSRV